LYSTGNAKYCQHGFAALGVPPDFGAFSYSRPLVRDVTQLLNAIDQGDPHAAGQLAPLVYEELRRLAGALLAGEKPGPTLDPPALVHEAFLRLVGDRQFADRRHFFRVAAEAMRRILIDHAPPN